jgi:hypothetical protein
MGSLSKPAQILQALVDGKVKILDYYAPSINTDSKSLWFYASEVYGYDVWTTRFKQWGDLWRSL